MKALGVYLFVFEGGDKKILLFLKKNKTFVSLDIVRMCKQAISVSVEP